MEKRVGGGEQWQSIKTRRASYNVITRFNLCRFLSDARSSQYWVGYICRISYGYGYQFICMPHIASKSLERFSPRATASDVPEIKQEGQISVKEKEGPTMLSENCSTALLLPPSRTSHGDPLDPRSFSLRSSLRLIRVVFQHDHCQSSSTPRYGSWKTGTDSLGSRFRSFCFGVVALRVWGWRNVLASG